MSEPLKKTVRVACPVAHAFEVFTSKVNSWWPAGHRKFPSSTLRLEVHEGGRFFERAADGTENNLGVVLHCKPPHEISYSWHPGSKTAPTRVDISFVEENGQTVVTVLHSEAESGLGPLWPERTALFTRGWDHVLAAFSEATSSKP